MKKKALFLFSKASAQAGKSNPTKLRELLNNAPTSDIVFEFAYYEDLVHVITTDAARIVISNSNVDIADYDVVYQRQWQQQPALALSCAIYLQKMGIPFVDAETYQVGSLDKLCQHWRLWEADLPVPNTLVVPADYKSQHVSVLLQAYGFEFPLIVKSVNGTRGGDNYLVKTSQELSTRLKDEHSGWLIQEFIPNDGDYRVFVTGDTIGLVIERQADDGGHKNNTSLGGKARIVEAASLSLSLREDSIKAAQAFSRNVAGVDAVVDKRNGKYYFFEVNRAPQIEDSSFESEKALILSAYLESKAK